MNRLLETLVEMSARTPGEHDPSDTFPCRCGSTPVAQMPGDGSETAPDVEIAQLMTYHRGGNSIGDSQWHVQYISAKEKEKMYFLADDSITCILQ